MNIKKWSTLLVLALFVVSIMPAVFADEGSDDSNTGESSGTVDDSTDIETNDASTEKLNERLEKQREEIQKAREKMLETRAKIMHERADFMEARAKVHEKGATLADKQDFLLATTDKVLELLGNLRDRVEASDVENKEDFLVEIDASIEKMTTAQASIEAIDTETATKEEIKAAVKELREAWKDAQKILKRGIGHVIVKRVGNVIEKMDHLDDKLDRILAHLTEKGYDVSVAADLKVDFEAKLDSAEAHWTKSKELFDAGSHQEANVEMRAAIADTKSAHEILKQIVKSIRETAGKDLESAEKEAGDDDAEDAADDDQDEAEDHDDAEDAADDDDADEDHDDDAAEDNDDINATA